MAISYPLNFPTNIGFEKFDLTPMNAVSMLRSPFTYQTQVQQFTGQLWMVDATIVQCKRDQAEAWNAFLLALDGPYGTFLMGDPNAKTPQGVATGSPQINGAGQTGETLVVDGWGVSVMGILKAGDYIQVGQRLHKLKVDANSNSFGSANLEIWPRLREVPTDNAPITISSPMGLFRLSDSSTKIVDVDQDQLYNITFSAVEAI